MRMIDKWMDWLNDHAPAMVVRTGVAIVLLLGAYFLSKFAAKAVKAALSRRGALTLAPVVSGLVRVVIFAGGLVTALSHVGINVGPILAGAGVVGLAVGFGAQALVKDVLSGFFMILDDVIEVGDSVRLKDGIEGVVEFVSLRMTAVRSFEGRLWYVPNGSIDTVGNFNRGWARAVVEVGIAYESDVERAMRVMKDAADSLASEKKDLVLEAPMVEGLMKLGDSAVHIRAVVRVKAMEQGAFERELMKRIKSAFDSHGIEIPYPRRVIVQAAAAGAR